MLSIVGNGSVAADITSFLVQSPALGCELFCLGEFLLCDRRPVEA